MNPRLVSSVGRGLGALRLGLLLLCVLGACWLLDPASADPLAPKELWFAAALGCLPALAALRLWWDQPLRLPAWPVLAALAVFAAAATLSYLASPLADEARCAWQVWLLSALLVAAGVDCFADAAARTWFLRGVVLAAGGAGLRSLAQRCHVDPSLAALDAAAAFQGRVAGCFGNPNFAGGFFALVLPVLLQRAWAEGSKPWRWSARAASGLALLGLLLAAGKAALLGLAVSAAMAGHLLYWSGAPDPRRRRALALLAGLAAAAVAAGFLALPGPSLGRLAGGPAAWSGSLDFRRVTWAGTWNLFRARPFFGWGPGTFSAAYPAFRLPAAMAGQQQHAYEVGAPENWVLQILAEGGLFSLAALLAALAALLLPLRAAARAWDREPERAGLCLALLCGVGACLACNLASLDLFLPSTLLPFLLFLGLGAALTAGQAPALSLNPEPYARVLVSLALAFMASVPLTQALLHVQAARRLAAGLALSRAGRFQDAVPDYELAIQFDPGLLEARYFLGCDFLDLGGPANLASAGAAFAGLRHYAPDYVQVHARLGRLRAAEGRTADAAAEYGRQLELDPWDLATVEALADLDAAHGRLGEAEAVLSAAAGRWPRDRDIARNLAAVRAARALSKGKP